MLPIHRKIKFITPLIFLLLLTSCGLWDDFTTYFNLYYNTTDLYDKAEEQILLQKKELFSTEPPVVAGNVNSDLVKVIEKCSNILQFSNQTSYVDDALMILGKCFYYQKNYQKSQRKFEELLSSQPESNFVLEGQLWIGKCYMRLKNYTEGLTRLAEVRSKAIEEGEDEIIEESYIEEIVYKKTIEDISGAIASANELLRVSSNDDIRAEVLYEVGNLNLEIGEIENAITAYQNVFEYSPAYELEVSARLKLGRALRDAGKSEQALNVFEDMRSEDKFEEKFADIDFEIGKTQAALGNYEDAINQLTKVDTTYKNTPNSGAAKYEIAKIYELGFKRLDSAAVYYKRASATALPPEYQSTVKEKDRIFTRYTHLLADINKYNKQLFYLNNPEQFIQDSINYVQDSIAIAEEIANVKELQEIWGGLDSLMNVKDTTGFYSDSIKVADILVGTDTTEMLTRDSVFMKIRDPELFDSLLAVQFDSMFTNKTFDPEAKQRLEQQNRERQMIASQLAAELPDTLKFSNTPPRRPSISEDSLNTILAKSQLELGNLFLSELNLPDSAYWYYNNSLTKFPDSPFYATTIYAMGSYYLTVEDKQRADSLFNIIYENYRNESIVNAAADKLNKPLIDLSYDPALEKYSEGEDLLLSGAFPEAVNTFFETYKKFPQSLVAPKALYTCGWIYENEIHDPVRAAEFYDTLIANYPASEYVRAAAPKVTIYKQELRKRELALKDSLESLAGIDSLAVDSLLTKEEIEFRDTIQVVLEDEDKTGFKEEEKKIEDITVHKTKEPVWNPRRRR